MDEEKHPILEGKGGKNRTFCLKCTIFALGEEDESDQSAHVLAIALLVWQLVGQTDSLFAVMLQVQLMHTSAGSDCIHMYVWHSK